MAAKQSIYKTMEQIKLEVADMKSLEGYNYMSETVIEYYFAHLRKKFPSDRLLLIPPSVSVLMLMEQNDDLMFVLRHYELIIFPIRSSEIYVNKNLWSLVTFNRMGPWSGDHVTFVHHDLCGGANRMLASQYFDLLHEHIGYTDDFNCYEIYYYPKAPTVEFLCGDYVLAVAELICKWYDENKRWKGFVGHNFWLPEYQEMMLNHRVCYDKRQDVHFMVKEAMAPDTMNMMRTRL